MMRSLLMTSHKKEDVRGKTTFCDADEGCQSDDVDCIDDRGFDEDDYNG
jgi:hypothetical protein